MKRLRSPRSIFAMLGFVALMGAIMFAATSTEGKEFRIVSKDAPLDSKCGVTVLCVTEEVANDWVDLSPNYEWRSFPGIVHDHPPLKCEEDDLLHTCSERYRHRFDPKAEEPGYYLLTFRCDSQTITRMNDGAYPDGKEVKVYEDCPEDSVRATPTVGPSRE